MPKNKEKYAVIVVIKIKILISTQNTRLLRLVILYIHTTRLRVSVYIILQTKLTKVSTRVELRRDPPPQEGPKLVQRHD